MNIAYRKKIIDQLTNDELFTQIENLYVINANGSMVVVGHDKDNKKIFRVKLIRLSGVGILNMHLEMRDQMPLKSFTSLDLALSGARQYIIENNFPTTDELKFFKIKNPNDVATDKQLSLIKWKYPDHYRIDLTKGDVNKIINVASLRRRIQSKIVKLDEIFYVAGDWE